jgi:hypothetical protein
MAFLFRGAASFFSSLFAAPAPATAPPLIQRQVGGIPIIPGQAVYTYPPANAAGTGLLQSPPAGQNAVPAGALGAPLPPSRRSERACAARPGGAAVASVLNRFPLAFPSQFFTTAGLLTACWTLSVEPHGLHAPAASAAEGALAAIARFARPGAPYKGLEVIIRGSENAPVIARVLAGVRAGEPSRTVNAVAVVIAHLQARIRYLQRMQESPTGDIPLPEHWGGPFTTPPPLPAGTMDAEDKREDESEADPYLLLGESLVLAFDDLRVANEIFQSYLQTLAYQQPSFNHAAIISDFLPMRLDNPMHLKYFLQELEAFLPCRGIDPSEAPTATATAMQTGLTSELQQLILSGASIPARGQVVAVIPSGSAQAGAFVSVLPSSSRTTYKRPRDGERSAAATSTGSVHSKIGGQRSSSLSRLRAQSGSGSTLISRHLLRVFSPGCLGIVFSPSVMTNGKLNPKPGPKASYCSCCTNTRESGLRSQAHASVAEAASSPSLSSAAAAAAAEQGSLDECDRELSTEEEK